MGVGGGVGGGGSKHPRGDSLNSHTGSNNLNMNNLFIQFNFKIVTESHVRVIYLFSLHFRSCYLFHLPAAPNIQG